MMDLWKEIRGVFREEVSLRELTDPRRSRARLWSLLLLVRETYRSVMRNQTMTQAGALAFKTLTALVPMLAIALAVLTMLDAPDEGVSHTENFIRMIRHYIPATSGMDELFHTIRGFAAKAKVIAGVGFLLLFFTAYSLMGSVEEAFNRIWQVRARRQLLSRITAYLATLILVPVLMSLSVYLTARIAVVTDQMARSLPVSFVTRSFSDTPDAQAQRNAEEAKAETGTTAEAKTQTPETEEAASPKTEAAAPEKPAAGAPLSETAEPVARSGEPPVTEGGQPVDGIKTPEALPEAASETAVGKPDSEIRQGGFDEGEGKPQGVLAKIVYTGASTLISILALTCLYYFLPFTPVKWRSALVGAVFAGLVLEATKSGFRYYAVMAAGSKSAQIYGSLLAVPLALLWLWLIWVVVLGGAELAFTVQNVRDLAARAEIEKRGIVYRLYLAVRTVLMASEYFRRGERPAAFPERVAQRLEVPPYVIREILLGLEEREVLRRVVPDSESYLPAKDLSLLTVEDVVRAVARDSFHTPEGPVDVENGLLSGPFRQVDEMLHRLLGTISFEEMVCRVESAASVSAPALAPRAVFAGENGERGAEPDVKPGDEDGSEADGGFYPAEVFREHEES